MSNRKQKNSNHPTLQEQYQSCPRAHFFQRLGAYIYDILAIAALLMLATVVALIIAVIAEKLSIIDTSAYQDLGDYLSKSLLFASYLAAVIIGFYGYFWTNGGQTIGMKAWRLRVQNSDGSNISMTQALIRMATSAFGLGNLMAIFTDRNAFQDLWAECEIVVLPKELSSWKGFKGLAFLEQNKK